ncbi:MAG: type III-B CRISPR module RAMP protein Cmr6 [Thermodesulfovibrionales bacterium]|nr:type III-B CRISPR module RAMP protein Cmr6 [Thermodesulfovibrionales bacterium]
MTTNASRLFYISEEYGMELNKINLSDLLGLDDHTNDLAHSSINGRSYPDHFLIKSAGHYSFSLKTAYPGLLIGAGYSHPAVNKGDFQLGFFFDHTTGLPVIPGSSIKGILKSVFPKKQDDDDISKAKLSYVNHRNYKINKLNSDLITTKNWENTFFNQDHIFLDAYISEKTKLILEKSKLKSKIFDEDYITHHKSIFEEPVPIRFLKVASGVIFKFQFILKTNSNNLLSPDQIKNIFKQIIIDFGIGAKRNVGYGNFVEEVEEKEKKYL